MTIRRPINRYQQRFWLEWKLNPTSTAYNTPLIYSIRGELNEEALQLALTRFVNHYHEDCKSNFILEGEKVYQVIYSEVDVQLHKIELQGESLAVQTEKIAAMTNHFFNLETDRLFQFSLLKKNIKSTVLILNFHHIISDATSARLFIGLLSTLYHYYAVDKTILLPDKHTAVCIEPDNIALAKKLTFWKKILAHKELRIPLLTQKERVGDKGHSIYFCLPQDMAQEVRLLCKNFHCTPFILLSAIFSILLAKYTAQKDIVLHYAVDSRQKNNKNTIGCFINNLPLITECSPQKSLHAIIEDLKNLRKQAKKYQDVTLSEILTALRSDHLIASGKVFNIGIIEAYFDAIPLVLGELSVQSLQWDDKSIFNDLLLAYQLTDRLKFRLDYSIEMFDEEWITNFVNNFKQILRTCLKDPTCTLAEMDWINPLLLEKIQAFSWQENNFSNVTETVVDLFRRQAKSYPNQLAIAFNSETIFYRELDEITSKLALVLIKKFSSFSASNAIIGVYMEKNPLFAIAILGILKCGKAYLPLNVSLPPGQLQAILNDSKVACVLSSHDLINSLPAALREHTNFINLTDLIDTEVAMVDVDQSIALAQPAYVIYTSGSTGTPKGIIIHHQNLANVIQHFAEKLCIGSSDCVVTTTAISFDIFALEFFLPLCVGAQLIFIDKKTINEPMKFARRLNEIKPTFLQGTPAFWHLLKSVAWLGNNNALTTLCGGESLPQSIAEYLLSISKKAYQVYGPSETTIWSTFCELSAKTKVNCIGKAIRNTALFVFDEHQKFVPPYVSGELYIGGVGVAEGYINFMELTRKNFIPATMKGASKIGFSLLYRTGDKVFWDDQGNINFIGRKDNQVKLRGHRVELGEIESCLMHHPHISQAVVKTHGVGNNQYLVAYIVKNSSQINQEHSLQDWLQYHLPSYMVPNSLIELATFPLSANGKIDRLKLNPPLKEHEDLHSLPTTMIEKIIGNVWENILKIKSISVNNHFFGLGGNSLLAIHAVTQLSEKLQIDLPAQSLLMHPTIRQLAIFIQSHWVASTQRVIATESAIRYALTPAQKNLYLISKQYPQQAALYNIVVFQKLTGLLKQVALIDAINSVLKRHASLRTIIHVANNHITQVVLPYKPVEIKTVTISAEALEQALTKITTTIFNLNKGPLYHFELFSINEEQHMLALVFHHLIIDGWSLDILRREINYFYNHYDQGIFDNLPEAPQYAQHILSLQSSDYQEKLKESMPFWQNYFSNYVPFILPQDFPCADIITSAGKHYYFEIDQQVTQKIMYSVKTNNTTLFNFIFAAYAILLSRYTGKSDLIIGTLIANRNTSIAEKTVGYLANILCIRVCLEPSQTIPALLREINNVRLKLSEYDFISFEDIMHNISGLQQINYKSLLQTMLVLQNANESYNLELKDIKTEFHSIEDNYAKYNLLLTVRENGDRLSCCIEYASDLFKPSTIQGMSQYFASLLSEMTGQVNDLAHLSLLSMVELTNVAPIANVSAFSPSSIVTWFSKTAKNYPDRCAISFADQYFTYLEVDQCTNQLAHYIRYRYQQDLKKELQPNTLIGLCVQRGIELLLGVISILKAGGAYVPIDPSYPTERIQYILNDSAISLLLTTENLENNIPQKSGLSLLMLDKPMLWESFTKDALEKCSLANNLAYVIYTSGSTGQPKAVLLTHKNVIRLFQVTEGIFHFTERDVWSLFHSYAFDFSVWEIWGALFYGGHLVIVPHATTRDTAAFYKLLAAEKVTILNQTPTAFSQLINEDKKHLELLPLRYVIFGGEALNLQNLAGWWKKYPDYPQLINMYGITETTVHVTFKKLSSADLMGSYCNDIGKPLADLRAYILDENKNLCAQGVVGELYIAGEGLAKGYLNQPKLSAEAFITLSELNEKRLYKTGDLARWLENGSLEYLGRNDFQVKVRGFRIELGEIQWALMRIDTIENALVLQDSAGSLVAYYTSRKVITAQKLMGSLKQLLPEYMLPSAYIGLTDFPLTANGKVDREKLLKMSREQGDKIFVLPRTSLEKSLIEIWQYCLNIKQVSTQDDFFTIGGDSIRSLYVIEMANTQGIYFTPKDLYENPTVASLARVVSTEKNSDNKTVLPFDLIPACIKEKVANTYEDVYPCALMQEGMIFYSQYNTSSSAYLDVIACIVDGDFNLILFETVFKEHIAMHAILRTEFKFIENILYQCIKPSIDFSIQVDDISDGSSYYQAQQLQQWLAEEKQNHFTISTAPLWRISVRLLGSKKFHFALTCHHAILDGWSVAAFLTSVFQRYHHYLLEKPSPQKVIKTQYRDFIRYERDLLNDKSQKKFWEKFQTIEPFLLRKTVFQYAYKDKPVIKQKKLVFSKKLSKVLPLLVEQWQVSLDNLLLTVHLQALAMFSGQSPIITGIAANGRLPTADSGEVLGLFLNIIPFMADVSSTAWREKVSKVIDEKNTLYDYCHFPLNEIYKLTGKKALFDTLFNFVNFHVFDQLKSLSLLCFEPTECYEETNYTLVTNAAIHPLTKNVEMILVYDEKLLSTLEIERLQQCYQYCLRCLIGDGNSQAAHEEFKQLFPPLSWYFAESRIKTRETMMTLFDKQVKANANNIALKFDNMILTYQALDEKANQLANAINSIHHKIHGKGIVKETLIGIVTETNFHAIISMLAILKLNGVYVPFNRTQPLSHLKNIMAASQIKIILHDHKATAIAEILLAEIDGKMLLNVADPIISTYPTSTLNIVSDARDLAYVMFTSGSTGRPKGVEVQHRGITRLVVQTNYINISAHDKIVQVSSLNFDASTFEIWGALLNGGTIVICEPAILLDTMQFRKFLTEEKITILWLTARLFDQYISHGASAIFKDLRYFLVGGDVVNKTSISQLLNCPEGAPKIILNGYGPTENTTFTTIHTITKDSLNHSTIPIGKPISGTSVFVVDQQNAIATIGATGKLYIAGEGLARAYLQDDLLTNASFIELPAINQLLNKSTRVYQSGDLVRWLPCGNLEFIGRVDKQVKINGFRVELEDVENKISHLPGVQQCLVILDQASAKIIAYCVFDYEILNSQLLRTQLKSLLPHYMVPTTIIEVQQFPLTANGKIDHSRLPVMLERETPKPVSLSSTEKIIHDIWVNLLSNFTIGKADNFFDVGGDSLLAMKVHYHLSQKFTQNFSIIDIFRYPTIQDFANYIDNASGKKDNTASNKYVERRDALNKRRAIAKFEMKQ